MKIQTLFCPGSYGTYLSWAVYTYSNLNSSKEIILPFGPNGSAHLYRRSPGYNFVTPTHKPIGNVTGTIFVVPSGFLEYTDNQLAKQSEYDNADILMETYSDYYAKLDAWGNTHEHWEHRELLSLMILDTINSTQQQFKEMQAKLENFIQVTPGQILDHLCKTLQVVFEYFNLVQWCSNDVIESVHTEYLRLQRHRHKDLLIQQIINGMVNNKDMQIPEDLTLFDQAMIQGLLREHDLELRCYGLNQFPKTTAELRSFTYQRN